MNTPTNCLPEQVDPELRSPSFKYLRERRSTVLVVDDVRDYCDEIADGLRRDGHQVYVASNGSDAIALGSLIRPDVVVTDWMLKDHIHGLDVSDAISLVCPCVRTILITGFASEDLRVDARSAEVFEFLEKPFPMTEIRQAVKRAAAAVRPWKYDLAVGFLELSSEGDILYANVAAETYIEQIIPDGIATNIHDLLQDDQITHIERSGVHWVEVRPRSNEPEVWHVRTRYIPKRDSRVMIFFSARFGAYKHSAVVRRLLGLSDSPEKAPFNLSGHILVVDDYEAVRRLAVDVLRHFRCVCHTAESHEEAIRLFAHDIDITYVILDWEVPGGDASHFVERIRALRPDTRIIGTSGENKKTDFQKLGIQNFLSKPWEVGDLLKALDQTSRNI